MPVMMKYSEKTICEPKGIVKYSTVPLAGTLCGWISQPLHPIYRRSNGRPVTRRVFRTNEPCRRWPRRKTSSSWHKSLQLFRPVLHDNDGGRKRVLIGATFFNHQEPAVPRHVVGASQIDTRGENVARVQQFDRRSLGEACAELDRHT